MATHQAIEALRIAGVRSVRLQFSDLHGIVRGREIPIADFPEIAEDGTGFVEAVMTVDLRHNIVSGFAEGFRDLLARPDLDTLATLPWAPDTAICLCDLEDTGHARPVAARPARRAAPRDRGLPRARPRAGARARARVLPVRARRDRARGASGATTT